MMGIVLVGEYSDRMGNIHFRGSPIYVLPPIEQREVREL